jgi:hypothetical protein
MPGNGKRLSFNMFNGLYRISIETLQDRKQIQ